MAKCVSLSIRVSGKKPAAINDILKNLVCNYSN